MKAYTDIEQSKKLAEILSLESSDHHYVRKVCDFMGNAVDGEWSWPKYGNIDSKYANYIVQNFTSYEKIPCWSLSALLSVIPFNVTFNKAVYRFKLVKFSEHWECYHENFGTVSTEIFKADNPVDVCVEMILKLKEKNLL